MHRLNKASPIFLADSSDTEIPNKEQSALRLSLSNILYLQLSLFILHAKEELFLRM